MSPGVDDIAQQTQEILDSVIAFFTEHDIHPAWFTLNLSCPNTEDDPGGNQTAGAGTDVVSKRVHRPIRYTTLGQNWS